MKKVSRPKGAVGFVVHDPPPHLQQLPVGQVNGEALLDALTSLSIPAPFPASAVALGLRDAVLGSDATEADEIHLVRVGGKIDPPAAGPERDDAHPVIR